MVQVDSSDARQVFRALLLIVLLVMLNGCAVIGVSYWPFSREITPSKETVLNSRRVCNIYYASERTQPVKSKAELISSWGRPHQIEIVNGIEKLTFNEKKRFWSGIGLWPVFFKIPLVWLPINRNACVVEIENDKIVGFSYYRQAPDKFYGCGVYYDWVVTGAWRYGCGNNWGLDP